MSFSKGLSKQVVDGSLSVEYTMDITINGKAPKLYLRFAGRENDDYFAAADELNVMTIAEMVKSQHKPISRKKADETRENNIELFPLHIITGWRDVIDDNGKAVEFTTEKAREFCQSLVDSNHRLFDDICEFASNPNHYMKSNLTAHKNPAYEASVDESVKDEAVKN